MMAGLAVQENKGEERKQREKSMPMYGQADPMRKKKREGKGEQHWETIGLD